MSGLFRQCPGVFKVGRTAFGMLRGERRQRFHALTQRPGMPLSIGSGHSCALLCTLQPQLRDVFAFSHQRRNDAICDTRGEHFGPLRDGRRADADSGCDVCHRSAQLMNCMLFQHAGKLAHFLQIGKRANFVY